MCLKVQSSFFSAWRLPGLTLKATSARIQINTLHAAGNTYALFKRHYCSQIGISLLIKSGVIKSGIALRRSLTYIPPTEMMVSEGDCLIVSLNRSGGGGHRAGCEIWWGVNWTYSPTVTCGIEMMIVVSWNGVMTNCSRSCGKAKCLLI